MSDLSDEDELSSIDSEEESVEESDEEYAPHASARASKRAKDAEDSFEEASASSDEEEDEDEDEAMEDAVDDALNGEDADDEAIARMLHREMNGIRARPKRSTNYNVSAPSPPRRVKAKAKPKPKSKSGGSRKRKSRRQIVSSDSDSDDGGYVPVHNRSTRSNEYKIARKSYAEVSEDEDVDEDDRAYFRQKTKDQQAQPKAAALMSGAEALDDTDYDIERVIEHRPSEASDDGSALEFRIKWKRRAYIHSTWESEDELESLNGYKRVTNYMRRVNEIEARKPYLTAEEIEQLDVERQMELQLVEEHMQVERIVEEEHADDFGTCYLLKWEGLPYSECTWDTQDAIEKYNAHNSFQDVVDTFQEYEQRGRVAGSSVESQRKLLLKRLRSMGGKLFSSQPEYITGKLRGYQLDGLNYLAACWARNSNCILADEMGLGKTIQCVSMLNFLFEEMNLSGPFLVVVPLSTVPNWKKELKKWAPTLNTIVYVGDGVSREVIRKYEVYNKGKGGRRYKMNVLLTTYEVVLKDSSFMKSIQWTYLMVDEAHRLKNNESALYRELSGFHCKTKLLVTGTPLQNNVKELWALLHFLHPSEFSSCEAFEETHNMNDEAGLKRLHKDLMPHLLRRTIKDVETSLPPKTERILRVEMSPLQKQYYKLILKRNFDELNKGVKGSGHVSLLNIVVELKKCCNHPFLFESAEEAHGRINDSASRLLPLVLASGKLSLLDKLLERLKATGHRVLIFSQMVRMLTILADYCRLKGFRYQQLDGSTSAQARHQAMEHFNAPESQDFIFLLSTRAGGLGINLATADTVVIFDSDWNPQNDLQAMSRAHRIGQKDAVNIYRFVTGSSVEEDILERAKQKMVLDQLVIQQMDTSGRTILNSSQKSAKQLFNKDDLQAILKFGAEDLFKEDEGKGGKGEGEGEGVEAGAGGVAGGVAGNGAASDQADNTTDLDAILARAEHVHTKEESGKAADFLSSFKVADIKTSHGSGEGDLSFWERLIPEHERPKKADDFSQDFIIPRAARMAAPKSYAEEQIAKDAFAGDPDSAEVLEREGRGRRPKTKLKPFGGKPGLGNRYVKNAIHRVYVWEGAPPDFKSEHYRAFVEASKQFYNPNKLLNALRKQGGEGGNGEGDNAK